MATSRSVPDSQAVIHQLTLRHGIVYVADVTDFLRLLFKGKRYDPAATFRMLKVMRNDKKIKIKRCPETNRVRVTLPGYLALQQAA